MKKRNSSNNVFCKFATRRGEISWMSSERYLLNGVHQHEHHPVLDLTCESLETIENDGLSFESIQQVLSELQSQTMLVSERLMTSHHDDELLDEQPQDQFRGNNSTLQGSSCSNVNHLEKCQPPTWATKIQSCDDVGNNQYMRNASKSLIDTNTANENNLDKENHCPRNNSNINTIPNTHRNAFIKNDFKSQKRSRPKEFVFEDEKECTFKPKINSSYATARPSNSTIPFAERMLIWQQRKNEQMKKKREEMKKEESSLCTFKPNVTNQILEKRNNHSHNESDLSYHQTSDMTSSISSSVSQGSCLKLYEMAATKEKERQQKVAKFQAEKMKECSFKPNIIVDPTVQPRYLTSISDTTKSNSQDKGGGDVKFGNASRLSSSSIHLKRPGSASPSRSSTCNSDLISNFSRNSFEEFMERQFNTLKRKEEKVKSLQSSLQCPHKPVINRMSQNITKHNGHERIEDRVRSEKQRKEIQEKYLHAMNTKDCTFKPKINKISETLPSRSVEEMSKGDLSMKQQKIEAMKKLIEQQELKEVTFHPKTNREVHVRSVLRISSDPDSYLERLRIREEKAELRKEMLLKEKEHKEMAECSFRPKTVC
ncbi:hypothetical protein FDP41_009860 [Naegleria fowleri]|uniref:Uncharacterized protein n=1 Tax=Naegleria fowleri TaxID=5763 RepID=A0A6A5AY96_NAEFO|nr:uncharacterized protein FDP41_009860 [Naegleria fowleri]KAF0971637.1 hypothetical protein FDP41_009860 [Naegleria fowleri]